MGIALSVCVHTELTFNLPLGFVTSEDATKLHYQDEQFHRRVKELSTTAKKTTELTTTTMALEQVQTHPVCL